VTAALAWSTVGEDAEGLRRFYTLDPADLACLALVRGEAHRLACALMLVWARAERILVTDPTLLPAKLIAFVSGQLGVTPAILGPYRPSPVTRAADAAIIRAHLSMRPFHRDDAARLQTYLAGKVATTGNTAALLDAADDWLIREGLLRPAGETTVERLMYTARAEAEVVLFRRIAAQFRTEQRAALDELCRTDGKTSVVATLDTPPRVPSAPAITTECARLEALRAVIPVPLDWGAVTANRRRQWAALVRRSTAQGLRRYPAEKRYTLLTAFLTVRQEEVTDAIIEMFDTLITRVIGQSDAAVAEMKLEQAQARLEGARLFRTVAEVLLDATIPAEDVRDEIFRRVPREQLRAVTARDQALERGEAAAFLAALDRHFRHLRSFAPLVLRTLRFDSTSAQRALLEAVQVLTTMNAEHRLTVPATAPVAFLSKGLARVIVQDEGVDRHGWEGMLLVASRNALRAGDLIVEGSRRYTPWDGALYPPAGWDARRVSWLAEHHRPTDGASAVRQRLDDLHELSNEVAGRIPENASVTIQRGKLHVSALERVDEPPGVEEAREAMTALLAPIDLPELLMEVDRRTNFMAALTHLTGRRPPTPAHLAEIRPALFAVLVAEATNLGVATMARAAGIPEGQLARVYDWYFREDTLRQAITVLLRYHQTLPLTSRFGSGSTSSSDGIRFGVAASALNARHNPRFMAQKRLVTVYSHVLDQGTQFWIDVVSCLIRESTYVLDGLVYQDAPPIEEHYTDTHGSTDLVWGMFEALGVRFAPRLADLPDQVLYRARRDGDYGALQGVLHQTIRGDLIAQHWDAINRLAASFADGLVAPSLVIAKLQALPRQHPLQQAIQELGRIGKTRHVLSWINDEQLRRRVLIGLNKQERLHALARILFFGRQGRFGDRGYEAQLNRASALSLVLNAVIVWNTEYLDLAAQELARRNQPVPDELWAHLTPLHWEHLHLVGRYQFLETDTSGRYRPLRASEQCGASVPSGPPVAHPPAAFTPPSDR